jgi:hypothetical protein
LRATDALDRCALLKVAEHLSFDFNFKMLNYERKLDSSFFQFIRDANKSKIFQPFYLLCWSFERVNCVNVLTLTWAEDAG